MNRASISLEVFKIHLHMIIPVIASPFKNFVPPKNNNEACFSLQPNEYIFIKKLSLYNSP